MNAVCDMLPPVRGTYAHDAPLKDLVWFRAGGAAQILFRPPPMPTTLRRSSLPGPPTCGCR